MRFLSTLCFLLFATITVASCDTTLPLSPDRTEPPRLTPEDVRKSTVSGDSVYWVDNYMAWEDSDGNFWEWERTGSDGIYPVARLYKNGSYLGQLSIEWDAPQSPVADTMITPEKYWGDRGPDGYIYNTGTGGSGGGPVKIESEPTRAGFGITIQNCVDLVAGVLFAPNCSKEAEAAQDAAKAVAITGTLGTFLSIATGGATTPYTASALAVGTANALSKLGSWIACKIA